MSDSDPAPDEVPDVTTTAEQPPADPVPADPVPAADPVPVAPVGVTPGSADLVPDAGDVETPLPPPGCPVCGHPLGAHSAGRCLIMLGTYGTEGPCPCPDPLP